jgi:ABC-type transporter Mla subunit MlaD
MPRFRRRLAVLLTADETLERANGLLERLDATLDEFDTTLKDFNATLARFTAALEQFGPVVAKVDSVGSDLEVAVGRVDELAAGLGGVAGPAFRLPGQLRRMAGRGTGTEADEPEAPPADPEP